MICLFMMLFIWQFIVCFCILTKHVLFIFLSMSIMGSLIETYFKFLLRVGTLLNYAHWNLFNDLPQFERHFWFHIYIYMLNLSTTIDRLCMTMIESLEWSLGWLKVTQTFLMYRSEIVMYRFVFLGIVLYWNSWISSEFNLFRKMEHFFFGGGYCVHVGWIPDSQFRFRIWFCIIYVLSLFRFLLMSKVAHFTHKTVFFYKSSR